MKCIVGLGNPGDKYVKNRHNVGFVVAEQILRQAQDDLGLDDLKLVGKFQAEISKSKNLILVKPVTFMNDSGSAVSKICQFYKIKFEDLYIIHDDLDIQIGNYKIQHGKGPKVHNGLKSVEEKLGSDQFWNVRVGVENREVRGNTGIPGMVYSLQNFSSAEREIIEGVADKIVDELMRVVSL